MISPLRLDRLLWALLLLPREGQLLRTTLFGPSSSSSASSLLLLVAGQQESQQDPPPPQCAEWTGASCSWEPNLQLMEVDFGPSWKESFYAYVTPDVSTFYNETAGSRKAVEPRFSGTFGKFINLSKDILIVYWDPGSNSGGQKPSYIATLEPFGSSGTATYIGHQFFVTKANDAAANADPASHVLHRWKIERGNSLYYYDPYGSTEAAMKELGEQSSDLQYYQMQLQNLVFAQQYKAFTNGVDYLALYKQKQPPRFHMWRADFFGQTHIVETKEIHFVETPDDDELLRGMSIYGPRPDEVTRMRKYRDTHPTLSLELKVLSCAPRVFEIKNFLSDVEVDHILRIASTKNLHRSTVSAAGAGNKKGGAGDTSDTRTSRNDWIGRHADFMIDAIYKRSADLLQMNEALLRTRRGTEIPEFTESKITIAEKLQLVHYDVGQKYTPHHDFAMPGLVNLQPSRFATILFYLNDDMKGGETTFPRWLNAETSEPLSVKPEKGKAILFYNLLPDGNYDERSQHEARPVIEGEKWLTNLWIWDPILDHTVADHA